MSTASFAREISIDYSDDELDALATAFNRPDLARRADRAGDEPIRRAQRQTALRGLVARRAIALAGSTARPRIAFLDPHATLLGAYLKAPVVATVRLESPVAVSAVSLFVDDEVVVHQAALPGQAIQRMTAHGRDAAPALVSAELALPAEAPQLEPERLEVTQRMVAITIAAIEAREPAPEHVPSRVVDVLYARVASGSVALTSRDTSGVVSAEKWAWIDAGTVGLWRVHTSDDSPMVTFISSTDSQSLAAEIQQAWTNAIDAASIAGAASPSS